MALLLEDVVELCLDELILLDLHQDVLDVLQLLIAHVPPRLGLVLLGNVEAVAKGFDLLVGLALLDQLFQLLLGVRLTDADYGELELSRFLFGLARISLALFGVLCVGGVDDSGGLDIGEHFDDGVLKEQEECVVEDLLVVVVTFEVIDGRHV